MPPLPSRAPRPALSEHPEFALMLAVTLGRFHCTLAEIREDYWLGRAWRALAGDPSLHGRVARTGLGNVLITGPRFGPAPSASKECARWRRHVLHRLEVDTAHSADGLGMAVRFAEERVDIAEGCMLSLLAQTVAGDARWADLDRYVDDLAPVLVPVAFAVERVVAA
jgi:hypothetical protein